MTDIDIYERSSIAAVRRVRQTLGPLRGTTKERFPSTQASEAVNDLGDALSAELDRIEADIRRNASQARTILGLE